MLIELCEVKCLPLLLLLIMPVTSQAQTGLPGSASRHDHHRTEQAGGSGNASKNERKSGPEEWFAVTRVVDGDTFWVDDGTEKGLKIRLIGVDAPEPRNTGTRSRGYFGTESTGYLKQMLTGKRVRLEFDVSRFDRYGRTLAYAYLDNGTFINAELVKNGYATVMTIPPNVKYADTFTELASKARKQKKGLWRESPSSK